MVMELIQSTANGCMQAASVWYGYQADANCSTYAHYVHVVAERVLSCFHGNVRKYTI